MKIFLLKKLVFQIVLLFFLISAIGIPADYFFARKNDGVILPWIILAVVSAVLFGMFIIYRRTYKRLVSAMNEQDEKLKEMAENISENERLATLGQLAAGVAHELNNPLGGIVVYSHLLREDTAPDDPRYSNIEKIIKESNRCKNIVKSLLDFARQSSPVFDRVDLNRIITEALNNIRMEQVFENINIIEKFGENLPPVMADASQIQEVFENIIRNAAEVMEDSGEFTITSLITQNEQDKSMVEVLFEDTGPGIPDEFREQIFDPFYTTKVKGHGTGLGLAVSYGIIERHKGSIIVWNRENGGAVFSVKLHVEGAAS